MNSLVVSTLMVGRQPEIGQSIQLDFSTVMAIDLDRLKHKMTQSSESEISVEAWEAAEVEYRRFLMLKQVYPGVSLVPSKQVDKIWHAHILDTRAYREDCDKLFGRFIDHYPYFGIYGEEDYQDLQNSFALSVSLYEQHFGPYPICPDAVATRCEDHACHSPSECACRVPGACK